MNLTVRLLVGVGAVAGCGRYGFDPIVGDGGGGDGPEPGVGPDTLVSNSSGKASAPAVVWVDGAYVVVWQDDRDGNDEIYSARVDVDGTRIGNEVRATVDVGRSLGPAIAWSANVAGVTWQDDRDGNQEIYFQRLDANAQVVNGPVRVTTQSAASQEPSITWSTDRFLIAWHDTRDVDEEIYVAAVSEIGVKIDQDFRLTNSVGSSRRVIVANTGSDTGAVWEDDRDGNKELYLKSLAGQASPETRVTNDATSSQRIGVVWGNTVTLVWEDDRGVDDDIFAMRVDPFSGSGGATIPISTDPARSEQPVIVSKTGGYFVAWQDRRDVDLEIYGAALDLAGTKLGNDLRLTDAAGMSQAPSLATDGTDCLVCWADDRSGASAIYCKRIDF